MYFRVLLVVALLCGACVAGGTAQAASPGQVCLAGADWTVGRNPDGTGTIYYIFFGNAFRIVNYGEANTYYGHRTGMADGYLQRWVINQSTCV